MLPSSGACAFSAYGPKADFAASADTAAMATWPSPMPPYSFGMCGSQRPAVAGRDAHLDDRLDEEAAVALALRRCAPRRGARPRR